jgi:surfeit locus 1 family protein
MPPKIRRALYAVVPALLVLLALGTWQVQRLHWKTDMLARIAASQAAAPIAFPATVDDPRALEYRRLVATGRFDHARESYYGAVVRGRDGGPFVLTPLLREGAAPLLVLRGFIKEGSSGHARPEGEVSVTGFAHPGAAPGWFTPAPDLGKRRFFALDIPVIARAMGLDGAAPVVLVALGPRDQSPMPEQSLPTPANPHLGYAITWYGLALALLAVFAVWARRIATEAA